MRLRYLATITNGASLCVYSGSIRLFVSIQCIPSKCVCGGVLSGGKVGYTFHVTVSLDPMAVLWRSYWAILLLLLLHRRVYLSIAAAAIYMASQASDVKKTQKG